MIHGATQNRRLLFFTLYIAYICTGIVSALPGPSLSLLATHTRVTLDIAGWIFSASSFGFMTGVVISGSLVRRIGPKSILISGLILMAVASIITPWTHLFPVLVGALFLEGIGFGVLDVSINIIVTLAFPDTLGETLNNLHSSFGAGALLGPLLLSVVLQTLRDMTGAYLVGGFIGIVGVLLLLRQRVPVLPTHAETRQQQTNIRLSSILRQPLLWLMAIQLFLYVGGEVGFGSWIVTAVSQSAAITLALAAPWATVFWAGLTAGRILGGQVLKRELLTEVRLLYVCAIGAGLSGLVVAFFPTYLVVSFIASGLMGLFLGPLWPGIMAISSRWFVHALNIASSTLLISAGVSGMILPVTIGFLIAHAGVGWGMAIPALCSLVIILPLSLALWQRGHTLHSAAGTHTMDDTAAQASNTQQTI
ncbi:MAG: MFS transporter [Ktedonobacteraceae bacterium]|nr:MFS transporter [Chloroflexota bacterium]